MKIRASHQLRQTRARPKVQKTEQSGTQDRVTWSERAAGGTKMGLVGAGLIGGGYLAFTAVETLFGFGPGWADVGLPLALSMAGGGAVGAAFGATIGVGEVSRGAQGPRLVADTKGWHALSNRGH